MLNHFWGVVIAGLCFAGVAFVETSEPLVLVEEGVSRMPVVIFKDAPPRTRRAAEELAEYIEKIAGARPDVIEGEPDPVPERAIWVGCQPVLNDLFPDLDFDFQYPEEILIAANQNHLVIAGRDRWDPDHMRVEGDSYKGRNAGLDGVQQEYGTANAVYSFLQDFLDVRWLWPGELGEDIIKKDTISFMPFEYRYHPPFLGRSGIFRFSSLESWRGISHEWSRFQRLQLDSLGARIGGHSFSGWWDRFGKTRPELFALQPDGTRGWPYGRTSKLCRSNPEVWDEWLNDVEAKLERIPNRTVFRAIPNDGAYSGYCICPNCLAWDHPDGEKVRYRWSGISQEYVAQSDRVITFANTLARLLKERYPDRDYYVATSTYGNAHPVPVGVVPDDNVIVAVFANILNRPTPDAGRGSRKNLADWGRSGTKNISWIGNMGGGAGWQLGFPNVAPRRVIDTLRFVAENNVMSIFFDTMWEHWVNQGPHYYMLAQMAWNPYADGEAILEDYYRRAFGPAADTMTAYWDLMVETSDKIVFEGKAMDEIWPRSPRADFYQQGYDLLDRAEEELADAEGVYGERLAFVRAGLDYLRLFRENQQLIARLEDVDGEDTDALTSARANWQNIILILEQYPFAFNSMYIRPRQDGRGHLESVNPDRRGRTWTR